MRQKTVCDCAHSNRDAGGLDLRGGLSLEAARYRPGGGAAELSFQTNHKVTCWNSTECHQEVPTSHRLCVFVGGGQKRKDTCFHEGDCNMRNERFSAAALLGYLGYQNIYLLFH